MLVAEIGKRSENIVLPLTVWSGPSHYDSLAVLLLEDLASFLETDQLSIVGLQIETLKSFKINNQQKY